MLFTFTVIGHTFMADQCISLIVINPSLVLRSSGPSLKSQHPKQSTFYSHIPGDTHGMYFVGSSESQIMISFPKTHRMSSLDLEDGHISGGTWNVFSRYFCVWGDGHSPGDTINVFSRFFCVRGDGHSPGETINVFSRYFCFRGDGQSWRHMVYIF